MNDPIELARRRGELLLKMIFHMLSPQERICLLYMAGGAERKEIAKFMGCDANAIYTYVYRIKRKLKVEDLQDFICLINEIIDSA